LKKPRRWSDGRRAVDAQKSTGEAILVFFFCRPSRRQT